MSNPFSLSGKNILVTGASSGIGKAIAIECSKMGAILTITGRNEEKLYETLSLMDGTGHTFFAADLNNADERARLIDVAAALQGLVNCAGIGKLLPFPFISEEALTTIINTNFVSTTLLSAQLVKKKKLLNGSSIVFISSIAGNTVVYRGNSMYAASKGAINAIAKNMAVDLADKGIRVNCILPAMIETPLIHDGAFTQEQLDSDMKKYPLKRYGKPEEVAYAAIYFLSDASSWTTGSNLIVDGGFTLL
jgi:NAD(P)-dependent dehydrogenase (short-subunit alcohol dehydrogenase family)